MSSEQEQWAAQIREIPATFVWPYSPMTMPSGIARRQANGQQ